MSKTGLKIASGGIATVILGLLSSTSLASDSGETATAKPAEQATPRVHRMTPGKPRPPVNAHLMQAQNLEPGVPASLVLQLEAGPGIEILDVQVEGGDGLSVFTVGPRTVANSLAAGTQPVGEIAQWEISATPTVGAIGQLSGRVTFRVNGVLQAAPFNLAVPVAGAKAPPAAPGQKPMGALVTTPEGELIDSMRAETTVR